MNKIYKVIWSKTRNCYVAVSELAKNHGKDNVRSEARGMAKGASALALCVALSLGMAGNVWAAPELPSAGADRQDYLISAENVIVNGLYPDTGAGGNIIAAGYIQAGSIITAGQLSVGTNNTVEGIDSAAIGLNNNVKGNGSIAIGAGHTVSGLASVAVGDGNTAEGNYSFAGGGYTSRTVTGTGKKSDPYKISSITSDKGS